MRRLILAGMMTALCGAAAAAQGQDGVEQPGDMPFVSIHAGLDGLSHAVQTTNRVYTLPPEVDVEVTGSVDPRHCIGDTTGQRICQDTLFESER